MITSPRSKVLPRGPRGSAPLVRAAVAVALCTAALCLWAALGAHTKDRSDSDAECQPRRRRLSNEMLGDYVKKYTNIEGLFAVHSDTQRRRFILTHPDSDMGVGCFDFCWEGEFLKLNLLQIKTPFRKQNVSKKMLAITAKLVRDTEELHVFKQEIRLQASHIDAKGLPPHVYYYKKLGFRSGYEIQNKYLDCFERNGKAWKFNLHKYPRVVLDQARAFCQYHNHFSPNSRRLQPGRSDYPKEHFWHNFTMSLSLMTKEEMIDMGFEPDSYEVSVAPDQLAPWLAEELDNLKKINDAPERA